MEYCTESEDKPCTLCGGCEERTFACSEDYYDWLQEQVEE